MNRAARTRILQGGGQVRGGRFGQTPDAGFDHRPETFHIGGAQRGFKQRRLQGLAVREGDGRDEESAVAERACDEPGACSLGVIRGSEAESDGVACGRGDRRRGRLRRPSVTGYRIC